MSVRSYSVWNFVVYSCTSVSFRWVIAYLVMVALAQRWKRRTKPLQLNTLMTVYNYGLSAANALCCGIFVVSIVTADRFFSKRYNVNVERAATLYWLLKLVEMMDTVFMVVRHKISQISFLHVYHHVSMVLLTDYFCHLAPWPAIAFPAAVNAFVHVVLYFYYGVSVNGAVSPRWKRSLTQMQLLQFAVGLVHAVVGHRNHGFCVYSIGYAISMLVLFGNFYLRTYVVQRRPHSN